MRIQQISGWVGLMAIATVMYPASTLAQIDPGSVIPDDTLSENSIVVRDVTVRDSLADLIEGGTIQDNALFHSFEAFNILNNQRVYFNNPAGIENIISRVTGDLSSSIDGTLGVDGLANLYFINPNGIIFGPNANLDINGSFTASTADRVTFEGAGEFSATNPNSPPLVTVNIPIGLQFGENSPAALVNSASLDVGGTLLSLSGGEVLSLGELTALEGDIKVDAVDGNVEIRALEDSRPAINGFSVELSASEAVNINGTVQTNTEDISITGDSVNIEDSQITLGARENIVSESTIQGNTVSVIAIREDIVSDLTIRAGDVSIRNSTLSTDLISNFNSGDAGHIDISADSVEISNGSTLSANFIIETATVVEADAIETDVIELISDGGTPSTDFIVEADVAVADAVERTITGSAGEITISANRILLDAGSALDADVIEVASSALSSSEPLLFSPNVIATGGEINLDATDEIIISNDSLLSNDVRLMTETSEMDRATTGQIAITTDSLTVSDSSIFLNNRYGAASASDGAVLQDQQTTDRGINIVANTITLDGSSIESGVGPNPDDGSGNINLTASNQLILRDESLIRTTGFNGATGGDISLENVSVLLGNPPTGSEGSDIIVRGDMETAGRSGSILVGSNTTVSGFSFQTAAPGNSINDIETDPLPPTRPTPPPPAVETNEPEEPASDLQESAGSFPNPFDQARRQCDTAVPEDKLPNGVTLTGRGGLPSTPTDLLEAESTRSDWVSPTVSPIGSDIGVRWADGTTATLPEKPSDRPSCRHT